MGEQSLFQTSAERLSGDGFAAPSVVTVADYRFLVLEQLAALEMAPYDILIEPEARNTAAAVCAAALSLQARSGDVLMLVAPSDHVVPNADEFRKAVRTAEKDARAGRLMTFGIRPSRPETGYGWLELFEAFENGLDGHPAPLKSFVEKPDLATAQKLLAGGRHLWNAGIFLFSTQAILDSFAQHAPGILKACTAAFNAAEMDLSFTRLAPAPWSEIEDISIDYAVMERADNLSVIPFGEAWSDLGDWGAVWREKAAKDDETVLTGPATAIDCHSTLLHATSDGQHLVGLGLTDIIVVAMPDAVLVAHKDRAQDVKQAVKALKSIGVSQAETLPSDYRPWG